MTRFKIKHIIPRSYPYVMVIAGRDEKHGPEDWMILVGAINDKNPLQFNLSTVLMSDGDNSIKTVCETDLELPNKIFVNDEIFVKYKLTVDDKGDSVFHIKQISHKNDQ